MHIYVIWASRTEDKSPGGDRATRRRWLQRKQQGRAGCGAEERKRSPGSAWEWTGLGLSRGGCIRPKDEVWFNYIISLW